MLLSTKCARSSVTQFIATIAAHQTVVLWGPTHTCPEEIKVIVEPLDKRPHHSTLEVTPGLINSAPAGSTHHITVELTHHSAQLVLLPPKDNLASLQVALEVYEPQSKSEPSEKVDIGF